MSVATFKRHLTIAIETVLKAGHQIRQIHVDDRGGFSIELANPQTRQSPEGRQKLSERTPDEEGNNSETAPTTA